MDKYTLLLLSIILIAWGVFDLKTRTAKKSFFEGLFTGALGIFEISALGRIIIGILGFFIVLGLMFK